MLSLWKKSPAQAQLLLQNDLIQACRRGDLATVKDLVENKHANLRPADSEGALPLGAAIYGLHMEVVYYIYERLERNKEHLLRCLDRNVHVYGHSTTREMREIDHWLFRIISLSTPFAFLWTTMQGAGMYHVYRFRVHNSAFNPRAFATGLGLIAVVLDSTHKCNRYFTK